MEKYYLLTKNPKLRIIQHSPVTICIPALVELKHPELDLDLRSKPGTIHHDYKKGNPQLIQPLEFDMGEPVFLQPLEGSPGDSFGSGIISTTKPTALNRQITRTSRASK
jgi:hypothetical protein